jgi:hypothetical protein
MKIFEAVNKSPIIVIISTGGVSNVLVYGRRIYKCTYECTWVKLGLTHVTVGIMCMTEMQ